MLGTILSTALALFLLALDAKDDDDVLQGPPPGMVRIEGTRAVIGTAQEEAEELIRAHPDPAPTIAGETPQHRVEVEDFDLMVTEVTNEQYARFVEATSAKPPYLWGREAIEAGRREFLEEQGRLAKEARERGERFVRQTFEEQRWWDENWEDAEWEVPTELLAHPATHVDFRAARAYARWAGVRLMTEFEFQCAARGDDDRRYPWGDDWEDGLAATLHMERDSTWPVGSFPGGAVGGVYDLAGNVWEWTASPYVAYEGYEPLEVKIERGVTVEGLARFDPSIRVTVGGAFFNPEDAMRVSTRQGLLPSQATDGLGFRCAASVEPGLDAARTVMDEDVRFRFLPEEVDFYLDGCRIARRWKESPGTAGKVRQLGDGKWEMGAIEGYAVIEGYEQVLWIPLAQVAGAGSVRELADLSEEMPVLVGLVSTSIPLAHPELEPGTYYVAWRGEKRLPRRTDEEAAHEEAIDWTAVPGFVEEQELFVWFDLEMRPLEAVKAPPLLYDRMRLEGLVEVHPFVPPTPEELEKLEEAGKPAPEPLDTLRFAVAVAGKHRGRGFLFDLDLKTEPDVTPDASWRLGR